MTKPLQDLLSAIRGEKDIHSASASKYYDRFAISIIAGVVVPVSVAAICYASDHSSINFALKYYAAASPFIGLFGWRYVREQSIANCLENKLAEIEIILREDKK